MTKFIQNAIAVNVDHSMISSAAAAILNKGWRILEVAPAPRSVSKVTITVLPVLIDDVYADLMRRKLEFVYGGAK